VGYCVGPVSFMKGFDAFAGVIKSGGKTRRAAKMVILNTGHPDILEFINSKANEEKESVVLLDNGYAARGRRGVFIDLFPKRESQRARDDEFMLAVANDGDWTTRAIVTGNL